MTPEEISKSNQKAQHELWVNIEKIACRKLAVQYAQSTGQAHVTSTLLENAEEIYLWLIKDIQ